MRTKTILLSGVVAALSGASLMAQVYSLNAVGYINVTCPPGFSIIADHLYANGNLTPQYISPLLDSQLLDGAHNGVELFKFVSGSYASFTVNSSAAWSTPTVTTTTFNPGEAAFLYNPFSTNITLTFVGTVPQGNLTNSMVQGFNLVSSIVPQSGAIDTVLGLTPAVGDEVFQLALGSYVTDVINGSGGWSTGAAPVPAVGEGFFYYTPTASGENWVRTFNVQ